MLKASLLQMLSVDDVVGFHITVNETKYELVKNYATWLIYIDDVEVYECFGYRRALQVIINRIGYGDLH